MDAIALAVPHDRGEPLIEIGIELEELRDTIDRHKDRRDVMPLRRLLVIGIQVGVLSAEQTLPFRYLELHELEEVGDTFGIIDLQDIGNLRRSIEGEQSSRFRIDNVGETVIGRLVKHGPEHRREKLRASRAGSPIYRNVAVLFEGDRIRPLLLMSRVVELADGKHKLPRLAFGRICAIAPLECLEREVLVKRRQPESSGSTSRGLTTYLGEDRVELGSFGNHGRLGTGGELGGAHVVAELDRVVAECLRLGRGHVGAPHQAACHGHILKNAHVKSQLICLR
jgi:hypothetical protein